MKYVCLFSIALLFSFQTSAKTLGIFDNTGFPTTTTKYNGIARFSILNDELFVASPNGIYKYTPNSDSQWTMWAMEGINVLDFALCDNTIIAIAEPTGYDNNANMTARLIKMDIGQSDYKDITTDDMQYLYEEHLLTYLMRMAQHPQTPTSLMVASSGGVMLSEDFGSSWRKISDWCFDYNLNQFLGWHPYSPNIMFYTSENNIFSATILRSENAGKDWDIIHPPFEGDNSAHDIAFDPSDASHLLISGEGIIWESNDYGKTWKIVFEGDWVEGDKIGYAYNIMFDPANPNDVYCVGCILHDQKITIFKSADKGHSWQKLADSELFSNHQYWVNEAIIFDNKIFINTFEGILTYNLSTESAIESINSDNNRATPEYYNLQGMRLEQPPTNQIYIERTNRSAIKRAGF